MMVAMLSLFALLWYIEVLCYFKALHCEKWDTRKSDFCFKTFAIRDFLTKEAHFKTLWMFSIFWIVWVSRSLMLLLLFLICTVVGFKKRWLFLQNQESMKTREKCCNDKKMKSFLFKISLRKNDNWHFTIIHIEMTKRIKSLFEVLSWNALTI